MKLHLPRALRTALMACITTFAGLTTTVGTGIVAGGVVAFSLVAPQAQAEETVHGITFDATLTAPYHNTSDADLASKNFHQTGKTYGRGSKTINGLYMDAGGVIQLNNDDTFLTVKYLYLDPSVAINNTADFNACPGGIIWRNTNAGNKVVMADGGWLDINAAYTNIDVSGVENGALYLNTAGALTLSNDGAAYALKNGVTVHATMASGETQRILMSGDFSTWTGTAKITVGGTEWTYSRTAVTSPYGANDGYMLYADTDGLKVADTTFYWIGDENGSGSWNDATWSNVTMFRQSGYVNDVNVILGNSDHTAATITVAGETIAHNVTVQDGKYTISYADAAASLAVNSLSITDGATLVLGENGTLKLSSLINVETGGTLTFNNANISLDAMPQGAGDMILRLGTGEQAGKTLRVGETKIYTGEGTVTGTATVKIGADSFVVTDGVTAMSTVVSEDSTYVMNDATSTANIVVESGITLKQGSANGGNSGGLGVSYLDNQSRTITVRNGGVLDVSGYECYYHVILEQGATLSNSGAVVSTGSRSLPVVDLAGDATVNAQPNRFGILGSGYGQTYLNLNGNTLTKVGSGEFHLCNTMVNNGTINVQQGSLELYARESQTTTFAADSVTVQDGAHFMVNAFGGSTLNITGSEISAFDRIASTEGATINMTDCTVTTGGTFEVGANSTINITGSEITNCTRIHLSSSGEESPGGTININGGSINVETIDTRNSKNNRITITDSAFNIGKVDLDNTIMSITGGEGGSIGAIHITGQSLTVGTDIAVNSLAMSARWTTASVTNIEAGSTMHIKGTGLGGDWNTASFVVNNMDAHTVLNVDGSVISDVGITGMAGTSDLNVNSGGALQFNSALERNTEQANSIAINLGSGAVLKVAGSTEQGAQESMVVNMSDGSKLESIGASAVVTAQVLAGSGSAEIAVDGKNTLSIRGAVGGDATYKKTGSGVLNLAGSVDGLKQLDVIAGTVNVATALSSSGRSINLAAGTTLGADLTLNGGTIGLNTTATAASLGNNSLTLDASNKTGLNLTVSGTEVVGTQLTLLSGVSELFGATIGEGGYLGTFGDYFTLAAITDLSQPLSALSEIDDADVNSIEARLSRSDLFLSAGSLYVKLAENIYGSDPLYWEPLAAQGGNGNWTGASWSEQNADGGIGEESSCIDPGAIADGWKGAAVFSGDASATVTVDGDAVVTDLLVENGSYSFQQGLSKDGTTPVGSLVIQDTLSIGENGSAILNMEATVQNIELTDSTSALTVNKKLTISEGGCWVATNGGTITNGLADEQLLVLKNAQLGGVATKTGDVVTGNGLKLEGGYFMITDSTLTGQIDNAGCDGVRLGGTIVLDTRAMGELIEGKETKYYDETGQNLSATLNGYTKESMQAQLFTSANVSSDLLVGTSWEIVDSTGNTVVATVTTLDGKLYDIATSEAGTEYVAADTEHAAVYNAADKLFSNRATALVLNGGSIYLETALDTSKLTGGIRAEQAGTVTIGDGVTLSQDSLVVNANTITILGGAGATYCLSYEAGSGSTELLNNVAGLTNAEGWQGTVNVGMLVGGNADFSMLGNSQSTVAADDLTLDSVISGDTGLIKVTKDATLDGGNSIVNNMTVGGDVSLGAFSASSLTATGLAVTGNLVLGKVATVNVGNELSVGGVIEYTVLDTEYTLITAATLSNASLGVNLDNGQMKAAAKALATSVTDIHITLATLMEVTNGSSATINLNKLGGNTWNPYAEKYGYTVDWDATGKLLQLTAQANPNYVKQRYAGGTPNAMAGAAMMDDAFASGGIGAGGDLVAILEGVDLGTITDKDLAAVAGSSTATLGMAMAGDVERQLRTIRNRTTTMGVNQCVVNEGMPYVNAWVNAEGNLGELDQSGTYSGYSLESWGGTLGVDVDVNPTLTLGLAVTAMYGNLTVDGPDMLDGDMDTFYLSAFARYTSRTWTHTFIGTVGTMDGSYERTVKHGNGSYKTEGDTDGTAFGLMYEVGRVFALDDEGDACWQPVFNVAYRHTSVGGYVEKGGDAALKVDDQTLDTVTFGAGARLQAVVGENLYNRTSVLELRALAKLDAGDRSSEADVAFAGGGRKATVESAELGAFGVELGAGLSVPLGDENSGTLFFDVSAEMRSGYSNVNGTVGYRINF